jgi:alkanesulfonate monooxygenase SsuD/methylene tetrahydromethanopterin reductase-like flavin-dependent oxidoreductase (luciferase family)
MLVGGFHFPTDYGIDVGELARELEAREFDSLFVCEHTHIPVSRRTPFPGGGELPKRYSHTHDPFVGLAFAAAATRTLRLGTGIALVPQRDPIVTAKSVASLDRLSGGRFVFGIGGGWNAEEMENHGTHYESRFKILRERVLAMQALWTQDKAEFRRPRRGAARARSECAARARSDMNARTHVFRTKCDAVPWFDLSVAASECTPMESIEQRVLGCSVHRDRGLWARGRGRTAPANWRRALWVHRGEEIARRV